MIQEARSKNVNNARATEGRILELPPSKQVKRFPLPRFFGGEGQGEGDPSAAVCCLVRQSTPHPALSPPRGEETTDSPHGGTSKLRSSQTASSKILEEISSPA